jgi:hypothetical protein
MSAAGGADHFYDLDPHLLADRFELLNVRDVVKGHNLLAAHTSFPAALH